MTMKNGVPENAATKNRNESVSFDDTVVNTVDENFSDSQTIDIPVIVSDVDLDARIPAFMQRAPFVFWKLVTKGGKQTKMPLKLKDNELLSDEDFARIPNCEIVGASSTDKNDWYDFSPALEALKYIPASKVDGLGIVLTQQGDYPSIVCVDLDHCIASDGTISQFASDMINRLDGSYIEISQSGSGLHIFFLDEYADNLKRQRNDKLEIYADKRFIALTGNIYKNHVGTRYRKDGAANDIIKDFFTVDTAETDNISDAIHKFKDAGLIIKQIDKEPLKFVRDKPPAIPTDELINIIRRSKQANKFNRLFNGDCSDFNDDHSRADFNLCLMLFYWSNGDIGQVFEIWKQSALAKRTKFDGRQFSYVVRTIWKAKGVWKKNGKPHFEHKKKKGSDTPAIVLDPVINIELPNNWAWKSDACIACPVGFSVDDQGTHAAFETRRGVRWQLISHSVFLVERIIRNIDTDLNSLQLRCLTDRGWVKLPPIPQSVFASNRQILSLADFGADIRADNAGLISKWIADFIFANKDNIDRIITVNSIGWQKDASFVYPNTDNKYLPVEKIRKPSEKIFTTSGSTDNVIPILNTIHSNDIAMAVIGAALAAPMIKLVQAPNNIVMHIYGTGGCGKTTAARLAFSLFGNPYAKGAIPNADISRSGADSFFAARTDFLSVIDDIDSVNDEKTLRVIQALPYQFANGTGALRGTKDGSQRDPVEYRGSLLTTGEHPINSATSRAGSLRRTLEFPLPDNFIPFEQSKLIADCIKDNYGLFGRAWIEFLLQILHGEASDFFTRWLAFFRKAFFERYPFKIPLLIENIALICLANFFFSAGVSKIRTIDDAKLSELQRGLRLLKLTAEKKDIADHQRAKDFIIDFILSHPKQFDETDDHVNEVYGCRRNDFTGILPTVLNAYLDKQGFDSKTVVKQLADNGFFKANGRNLAYPVKGFRFNKTVRMYVVPNHFIDGSDADADFDNDDNADPSIDAEIPLDD